MQQLVELRNSRFSQVFMFCMMMAIGTFCFVFQSAGIVRLIILLITLALCALSMLLSAYAFFDRAVKVRMDQVGIHDLRSGAQRQHIPWAEITGIEMTSWHFRSYIRIYLTVTLKDHSAAKVPIGALDMSPDEIVNKAKAIWKGKTPDEGMHVVGGSEADGSPGHAPFF
jgi:hypothetical protein